MKKILISLIFLTLAFACNKKENIAEINDVTTDSVVVEPKIEEKAIPMFQYELSPDEVSELLAPKSNDTLYVDNFFATWCGPCIREIPYFKEKMVELKDEPVKFTFINLDDRKVWNTDVSHFIDYHKIRENTILVDNRLLGNEFFTSNFKNWKGETIPFTVIKRGDKIEEINGSLSKEEFSNKISEFLAYSDNQNAEENTNKNSDKK